MQEYYDENVISKNEFLMFFFAIIAVTPKVNLHNLMIHTHTKIGPRIVLSRSKSHMGMFSRLLWTVQARKL